MNRFEPFHTVNCLVNRAVALRIVVLFCLVFCSFSTVLVAQIPENEDGLRRRVEQLEDEIRQINLMLDVEAAETTGFVNQAQVIQTQFRTSEDDLDPDSPDSQQDRLLRLPDFQTPETIYPTSEWSGFIQLDSGWVSQDEDNKIAIGDINSSTGIRRLRLRMSGNVRKDTTYTVDLDFAAAGHPSFRDVVLAFEEIPYVQNIFMGYFQQPFGLDAQTSGRELVVMERPLSFAFAPFRQTGIGTRGNWADDRISAALTMYRFPTNSFGVNIGDSGGNAMAFRLTALPIYKSDEQLVHLGFGFSYQNPGNNVIRYSIEPGFFVTDPGDPNKLSSVPVIVDTGNIPANFAKLFNVELAAHNGPLLMTSEARFAIVDPKVGSSLNFSGYSAQIAYVLTGESRPYDKQRGTFRRVTPDQNWEVGRGGSGAWEAAVEWSYIDLNDKDIQGGRVNNIVYGLNWYLHRHAKISVNFIQSLLDSPMTGSSRVSIIATRAQVEF